MTGRCELSDLPVEMCACRIHAPAAQLDPVETVGQPFTARYAGVCAACESPIREGQRIARHADPGAGYVHADGCRP